MKYKFTINCDTSFINAIHVGLETLFKDHNKKVFNIYMCIDLIKEIKNDPKLQNCLDWYYFADENGTVGSIIGLEIFINNTLNFNEFELEI